MTDTARLFIALWPDDDVRARLKEWRDCCQWPRQAGRVRTEKLHMTVHFLGDVEVARVPELRAALAAPFNAFTLQLGHGEIWPGGIAVLVPEEPPSALFKLHADLATILGRLGLPAEERAYRPHVTMARRAAGAIMPRRGPAIAWPVAHYALMESRPDGYAIVRPYS